MVSQLMLYLTFVILSGAEQFTRIGGAPTAGTVTRTSDGGFKAVGSGYGKQWFEWIEVINRKSSNLSLTSAHFYICRYLGK